MLPFCGMVPTHSRSKALVSDLPILIVEDDEPTQKLLQALLRRSGLVCEVAPDGAAAIEYVKTKNYAAIILDLMMPAVSGADVVKYLASVDSHIPVIICSAAGPAVLSGFDPKVVKAVIRKPFDVDQFVDAIKTVALSAEVPSRVLIIDDDDRDRYTLRAFAQPAEVLEAETGDRALEIIRQSRPDLVLLDLIMPGSSAEEVLDCLAAEETMRDIPVIIVTSRALSDEDRSRLGARAAAVIYKGDLSRKTLGDAMSRARKRPS